MAWENDFMPSRQNFPVRILFIAALLVVGIATGCRREAAPRVKKGQLTDEIFLKAPGFFVLSNRHEFMAVGVKCGAYGSLTLRLAKSSDGLLWTDFEDGIKSSKADYEVIFNGEKVVISSKDEKVAVARISFMDRATNMAIAAIDGVETLKDDSLAVIKVRELSYYQMGTNRLEGVIKEQMDQLR